MHGRQVLYTIYIVMGKPLCSKIPPFTLSFIMFGASSCMCIIFVWTDWGQWGAVCHTFTFTPSLG